MIDNIRLADGNASFIVMGDFNDLSTYSIEQQTSLMQVVKQATRGNSVLDKIVTDLNDSYLDPVISAPILSCDHSVVTFYPHNTIVSKIYSVTHPSTVLGELNNPEEMAMSCRKLINDKYRHYFEIVAIKAPAQHW